MVEKYLVREPKVECGRLGDDSTKTGQLSWDKLGTWLGESQPPDMMLGGQSGTSGQLECLLRNPWLFMYNEPN